MGISLSPKAVFNTVKNTAGDVIDVAKDAPGVVKETAVDVYRAGKYVAENPPELGQMARMGKAIATTVWTGDMVTLKGQMPAYPKLGRTELAKATQKGQGRTIDQPYIAGDHHGKSLNEPVNLVVKGSKEDLVKALVSQGWMKAPTRTTENYLKMVGKVLFGTERDTNGPVSAQHVDGQAEVMAFNKNDDYNAGRDHLRVYPKGTDPETGEPIWMIAATRDTDLKIRIPRPSFDGLKPKLEGVKFTHGIDAEIDRERDLVMHDLLQSGLVSDWAAVEGKRGGKAEKRLSDGRIQAGSHITDGKVYEVSLGK